jgi:TetR/AcrR family transcriptional regulator, regulator of cefoperazone and chloramphenicol sensitivity
MPAEPNDGRVSVEPTGRTSIITAAMEIIAERGEKATTVRAVAERAGVSPSLVVHHFQTKQGLSKALDDLVIERFNAAMRPPQDLEDGQELMHYVASGLNGLLGGDAALRGYLRRSILEGTNAGHHIFAELVEITCQQLRTYTDRTKLPHGRDFTWLAVEVLTVNLTGTLLAPVLTPVLGCDPYDPPFLRRRTKANLRFIGDALKTYAG